MRCWRTVCTVSNPNYRGQIVYWKSRKHPDHRAYERYNHLIQKADLIPLVGSPAICLSPLHPVYPAGELAMLDLEGALFTLEDERKTLC